MEELELVVDWFVAVMLAPTPHLVLLDLHLSVIRSWRPRVWPRSQISSCSGKVGQDVCDEVGLCPSLFIHLKLAAFSLDARLLYFTDCCCITHLY